MEQVQFLDIFEENVLQQLLRITTSGGLLDGQLLASEDIDSRWNDFAPEYMADAIKEIAQYPTVSIAWAGYLGLAIADVWDTDFDVFTQISYDSFYGFQGFDDMDEHIIRDLLCLSLDSAEAKQIECVLRQCAQCAVSLIRREQIEPQSPLAFYVFERTIKSMYRVGVAIQLKRLGYKFEKLG